MPNSSTHRDASNGGIDISGKCNLDHFLTKHRFRLFDVLIENYIFIEKLLFSLDTERMDIIVESVASKRFGWTNYQPIRMLYHESLAKSVCFIRLIKLVLTKTLWSYGTIADALLLVILNCSIRLAP